MKEPKQRRNGHLNGMHGVYLAAAELTKWGLIVSPTSRAAFGADLLVANKESTKAWSVQVKANYGRPRFWLLNKHSAKTASPSHIYVLVNLNQANARQRLSRPDFYVVPSRVIARRMRVTSRQTGAIFYHVQLSDIEQYKERWKIFGKALYPS